MLFMGVTIHTTLGASKSHWIHQRIIRRLDIWWVGNNYALLAHSVLESQSQLV